MGGAMFSPMAHPVPLTGSICRGGVDMPTYQSMPLLPYEAWTQAALYWNDPNQQFRKLFGYSLRVGIGLPVMFFVFFVLMLSLGLEGLGVAVMSLGVLGSLCPVLYLHRKLRTAAIREANEMSVRFFQPHGYRVEFAEGNRRHRRQFYLLIFRLDGQPIDPAQVPGNAAMAQQAVLPQRYPQPDGYGPTPAPGSAPTARPPGAHGYPYGQPQPQVPYSQGMAYPGQASPAGAPQQPPAQHYYSGPSLMGLQQGVASGQPSPPSASGGYVGHGVTQQQGEYQGLLQQQQQQQQQPLSHQDPDSLLMYSEARRGPLPQAGPTGGASVVGGSSTGAYPLALPSTTGHSNPKGESADVKAM